MNRNSVPFFHVLLCFLFCRQQHLEAFTTRTASDLFSVSLHAAVPEDVPDSKRRKACQQILMANGFVTSSTSVANAIATEPFILASRVKDNVQTPPSYGLEGADVYYPAWFEGRWTVQSTCTSVEAPCGVPLFGGNRTFENAQQELKDPPLKYGARFLRFTDERVIADREFNVRSIAQAVMGPQSVLDMPLVTPNKLTCILVPNGAPSPFQVDLLTLNRKQETPSLHQFHCSEVAREIIAGSSATVLKEIETISLYSYDPVKEQIQCRQRSAKFLLPSQQDPMALRMWQMTGGRPVDVRNYDVSYQRLSQ